MMTRKNILMRMSNQELDIYSASMMVEGADGYEAESQEEYVEALQLLINTGVVWELQGVYGRVARDYIEAGLCTLA